MEDILILSKLWHWKYFMQPNVYDTFSHIHGIHTCELCMHERLMLYILVSPFKKTMWKLERKLISSMYFVFSCTFWNFLYMINCWKLFFCKNWTIHSIVPVIHVPYQSTMEFSLCWFHLLMQCNRTLKVGFVTWYQHYRELL